MIFANHAHVFPKEIKPQGTVESLLRLMDDCEIERCVAFAPFQSRLDEEGFEENANVWLARAIKNRPELVGFGTVDMRTEDVREQALMIAQLGFKGIKLHPPNQDFRVNSRRAFELYDQAQSLGLFLSFHTGLHWNRLSESSVLLYDEVAWSFPNLRLSLEHVGGYSFFREALAVMVNNMRSGLQPRIYAGWTSISPASKPGVCDPWTLTDDELRTIIHQTGAMRSIFGIDFPYKDSQYTKAAIDRINALDIDEDAKRAILGDNLRAALGL